MDESKVIAKALNGDQKAFRRLYDSHVELIFRFLMQFNADRQVVSDWVQQAFIKAFRKLDSFNGQSTFRTWLFSIAINEMRSSNRKLKAIDSLDDIVHDSVVSEQIRDLDDLISIRDAISELDEQKRLVFMLYEVEGYSHREIAEMLGIGESTSRTILTRSKVKLRASLQGE